MNPIQEFLLKAQNKGSDKRVRELEHALAKAEQENAELRATLGSMQMLKEKYQMALLDVIGVLEKYGLVTD